MFKHRMEIVHNHGNGYRDYLFYQNVFPQRVNFHNVFPTAKDSQLRDYLEFC